MSATPNLGLPLIAAAQAQKHVTHNEALYALDALVQIAVLDKDLASPPASPAEGDRYIVGPAPSAAWAGKAGWIAARQDGVWRLQPPRTGFVAFVRDESLLYFHDGTSWSPLSAGLLALTQVGLLGIGTSASTANPFAAKLNGAVWTAKAAADGGTGDLRCAMSKEASAKTASLLFQTAYSGRAEIGLVGSDALSLRTSPDGATWTTALSADPASGGVDLAAPVTSLAAAATCDIGAAATLRVALTGAGTVSSFGTRGNRCRILTFQAGATLVHDAANLALPGSADIAAQAGDAAIAVSDATGHWRVLVYQRADGTALRAPPGAVRADVAQGLSAAQQLQARQNVGAAGAGTSARSAASSVIAADAGRLLALSGTWTLSLAAAATLGNGFSVELVNEGTGTITIDPNAAETVNGASSWPLLPGESCLLACDGAGWRTLLAGPNAGGWLSYAPAVTATSGSIGALGAVYGRYLQIGKLVTVSLEVTIATNSSAAGAINVGLPVPARSSGPLYQVIPGRETGISGKMLVGLVSGPVATVTAYDVTYPGGNGARLSMSGTYEAA